MKRRPAKRRSTATPALKERLRRLEVQHALVMGAINEGVYDWNVVDDTIEYSGDVQRAVGLPPELLRTTADWVERIHPEDLPRYRAGWIEHFKGGSGRFECEYRYRALDGEWRWARQHGLATRNRAGRAVRVIGSTGDITELKRAEEALRKTEERLSLASSAATEGIYEWDLASGSLFLTDRARDFFSLPGERLTPAAWNTRVHAEDFPAYREALVAYFKGRAAQLEVEYRVADAKGGYRWVLDRGIALRGPDGRVTRLIGALTDMTQRKRAEIEVREARDRARAALADQTATAEILRVMAGSPTDVKPVFDAIAASATRLCDASFCVVFRYDGELLTVAADDGRSPGTLDVIRSAYPTRPGPHTVSGRVIRERRVILVADAQNMPDHPQQAERARAIGYRSILAVPMMKGEQPIGTINVARLEARPFSDAQVELLKTFADQAVIAIENVRLFNETKEALEQQTAAAEVMKAISSSLTDPQPVFEAILTHASQLCQATVATVFLYQDGVLVNVAQRDASPEFGRFMRAARARPSPDTTCRRCALERRTIHTADLLNDPQFHPPDAHHAENIRTILSVPMMREETLVGVITMWRNEVRPFTAKQIALVETFASQAVIAIENVRLFNETKEALEQQTATAETIGVVAQSQANLQPVFDAIGRNAAHLCSALFSCVYRFDGELVHLVATHNLPAAGQEIGRTLYPMRPDRSQLSGRAVLSCAVQRLEDVAQDAEYAQHVATAGGWRRLLAVPMLREGKALGVIAVGWRDPGPIAERQVELLRTFAAQAVIAIENARLFNETREALEQQKALADVLGTISNSVADAKPVFDLILDSCQRLFEGDLVGMTLLGEDGMVRLGAYRGDDKEAMEQVYPYPLARDSGSGQAILDRRVVHFPDVGAPGSQAPQRVLDGSRAVGFKSIIFAPLLGDGRALGALWVGRRVAGPFHEREIELLRSFADQAVIAIQNAHMFNETKEALEQQTATAEILRVISSSPTDTQPVFDAIVRSGLKLFSDAAISVALPDGDQVRAAAVAESDPGRASAWRARFPFPLTREYMHGVAILDRKVVDLPDVRAAPPEMAAGSRNFLESGYRAITIMPMMHGEEAIGALSVVRLAPGPLSDKQLAVLRTFAGQAVIAIENVRLFNETKEALEQQQAAGEILRAISGSIADTAPVFDKIIESCQRLFAGRIVGFNLVGDDGLIRNVAYHGPFREEFQRIFPTPADRDSGTGRAILEQRVLHYPDVERDDDVPEGARRGCGVLGIKSVIFAPMLWEGQGLGAIWVGRDHISSFSEKEMALLRTFADQSVIAIQNARLFREIQDKSRQLEVASRHKSEFLANMSHELRTPLNAIIGFTRIVMRRSKELLEPQQYENLDKILTSGQHLLALINSILDLSKIEAGRVEVHPSQVGLAPLLEQCARTIEPLVRADAVSLVKDFNGSLPELFVDEEKLRQIVINLLSNAAKFTERGTIRLRAEAANGSVSIAVADTGIGIPADKLELIFEEFEQADASSTRAHGGTGLGLAIARRLARVLGGDVQARSAPGAGSTFTLTLPVRYAA